MTTMLATLLLTIAASPLVAQKTAMSTTRQSLNSGPFRVYVGTYTTGESKGIYQFEFDQQSGQLTPKGLAGETVNPSFLALHPNGRFLYAIGEVDDFHGHKAGGLSAFAIDRTTGKLTLLDKQPSGGRGPCFVSVHPSGKFAAVANYGGGSVAIVPLADDGRLAPASCVIQHEAAPDIDPKPAPRAHALVFDPAGRYAFVPDLGLNAVYVYRFDAMKGTLSPNDPPTSPAAPGSGPRHLALHPNGRYAYVNAEKGCTITAFEYDAEPGKLAALQTVPTLPRPIAEGDSTAEIEVHPSGRFLYCSNRGHDSIAIFSIEPTGKMTLIGHEPTRGNKPRHFAIDPTGNWLIAANQTSNTLAVFRIDAQTGRLTPRGDVVNAPIPVCVLFALR